MRVSLFDPAFSPAHCSTGCTVTPGNIRPSLSGCGSLRGRDLSGQDDENETNGGTTIRVRVAIGVKVSVIPHSCMRVAPILPPDKR